MKTKLPYFLGTLTILTLFCMISLSFPHYSGSSLIYTANNRYALPSIPVSQSDALILPKWSEYSISDPNANWESEKIINADGHPEESLLYEENLLHTNFQDKFQFNIVDREFLRTIYNDLSSWSEVTAETSARGALEKKSGFDIMSENDPISEELHPRFSTSEISYSPSSEMDPTSKLSGTFRRANFSHTAVIFDQNTENLFSFHTSVTYHSLAIYASGDNTFNGFYDLEVSYYVTLTPTQGNLRMHFRFLDLENIHFTHEGEVVTNDGTEPKYQLILGYSIEAKNVEKDEKGEFLGGEVSDFTQTNRNQENTTHPMQVTFTELQVTTADLDQYDFSYILSDINYNDTTTIEFDTIYPLNYSQISWIDDDPSDDNEDSTQVFDIFESIPGFSSPLFIGISFLAWGLLLRHRQRR